MSSARDRLRDLKEWWPIVGVGIFFIGIGGSSVLLWASKPDRKEIEVVKAQAIEVARKQDEAEISGKYLIDGIKDIKIEQREQSRKLDWLLREWATRNNRKDR